MPQSYLGRLLPLLVIAIALPTSVAAQEQTATPSSPQESAAAPADAAPENPFPRRLDVPEFPPGTEWLNVGGPLRMKDLKGKFVIFDFWTYCCINCIHILPELKKLEHAYPNELVVIGVHSAKFEAEKGTRNIEEAILRYEIEHPVINDAGHRIWRMYGVRSWPTVLMIDPEGKAIWGTSGEIRFEQVEPILKAGIEYYASQDLLDRTPLRFDLLSHSQPETPLRFPGKILADEATDRLFISDSNHNRIVVTDLAGKLQQIIGSGAIGSEDGDFESCSFNHPQGMFLHRGQLFVADTENHLLRRVDLSTRQVTTIAGTGVQAKYAWPGIEKLKESDPLPERWVGPPEETALNSPWALWAREDDLYIAMAGPHQIWKMSLTSPEIGPYAGNGREDIVDGPLVPRRPYQQGYSSFAQPSGLAADDEWLYVADSEGSSIRAVPFDDQGEVRTVVGSAELPQARLFTFGDQDGPREEVLLQHALGVVHHEGQLFIADTYNNKIKVINAETGETRTLAGTGSPGKSDMPGEFDEPSGLSYARGVLYVADTNNHLIRTVDAKTGKVGTLTVAGLAPPAPKAPSRPDFRDATQISLEATSLKAVDGAVSLKVHLVLPEGWKLNPQAPAEYWLEAEGEQGPVDRTALGRKALEKPAAEFDVQIPLTDTSGNDVLSLSMSFFYCQEGGEGLCKVGSVVWKLPVEISSTAGEPALPLFHEVK